MRMCVSERYSRDSVCVFSKKERERTGCKQCVCREEDEEDEEEQEEEEELPLTPPSEGLAAHFSSPGTVLVSSRVTKMHT